MGQIAKVDWLDRLTFCEIEAICEKEKKESDFMFLNIEFPIAEYSGVQVRHDVKILKKTVTVTCSRLLSVK